MFNEIMEYLSNHPEKADMILMLTPYEGRYYNEISVETKSPAGSVAPTTKRSAIQPDITMDICNGVPVYTVWDGDEVIVSLPIDEVNLIRMEYKEFDNTDQKGAVMDFSHNGVLYTMEILYSEE